MKLEKLTDVLIFAMAFGFLTMAARAQPTRPVEPAQQGCQGIDGTPRSAVPCIQPRPVTTLLEFNYENAEREISFALLQSNGSFLRGQSSLNARGVRIMNWSRSFLILSPESVAVIQGKLDLINASNIQLRACPPVTAAEQAGQHSSYRVTNGARAVMTLLDQSCAGDEHLSENARALVQIINNLMQATEIMMPAASASR